MRFVITAGPTREPIDPVRYLSNRSSGKMGYALAEAAIEDGHDVILISGPVCLAAPAGATLISVSSSQEMDDAVHRQLDRAEIVIMCAAVSDFRPAIRSPHKIKKTDQPMSLELVPTRDILASLGKEERAFLLVGFAAETNDLEENAQKKLREKNCDAVVANDVSQNNSGMESDENEVLVLWRSGEKRKISRAPKKNVARELIKLFSNMREKCLTKNS